jgi:hypothetical protein
LLFFFLSPLAASVYTFFCFTVCGLGIFICTLCSLCQYGIPNCWICP